MWKHFCRVKGTQYIITIIHHNVMTVISNISIIVSQKTSLKIRNHQKEGEQDCKNPVFSKINSINNYMKIAQNK